MKTAYTDTAGRAANYTELYTGDISGQTLTPDVYRWGTSYSQQKPLRLDRMPIFEGITLGKINITLGINASINGQLLAQTAVTLIRSTVVAPAVSI